MHYIGLIGSIFAFSVWVVAIIVNYLRHENRKIKYELMRIQGRLDALLEAAKITYEDFPNTKLSPEVREALQNGHKIKAIKLYRKETGLGLADSKKLIETIMP